jgi:hypothetical protein
MKRVSIESFPHSVELISPEKTVNNSHLLSAIQLHTVDCNVCTDGFPSDQRGQWLSDPQHRDAHTAYAITGVINGEIVHVIIDRTFIDEKDRRWIIAINASPQLAVDEHRQLLEKAAKLMRNQESCEMWCGIYSTVSHAWVEWRMDK